MKISFRHYLTFLFLSAVVLSLGCKTGEQATGPSTPDETEMTLDEELTSLQSLLEENRSSLRDLHTSQNHDIPEVFLQKDSSDVSLNDDPFDGYRVQIISTRNQPLADSVATNFRAWADTTIVGYTANTYVFFKQPFYKVHIGDFQKREQANSYSKIIKRRYPDAWVVHDRIRPSKVPADTASFSFSKPKKSE